MVNLKKILKELSICITKLEKSASSLEDFDELNKVTALSNKIVLLLKITIKDKIKKGTTLTQIKKYKKEGISAKECLNLMNQKVKKRNLKRYQLFNSIGLIKDCEELGFLNKYDFESMVEQATHTKLENIKLEILKVYS